MDGKYFGHAVVKFFSKIPHTSDYRGGEIRTIFIYYIARVQLCVNYARYYNVPLMILRKMITPLTPKIRLRARINDDRVFTRVVHWKRSRLTPSTFYISTNVN